MIEPNFIGMEIVKTENDGDEYCETCDRQPLIFYRINGPEFAYVVYFCEDCLIDFSNRLVSFVGDLQKEAR